MKAIRTKSATLASHAGIILVLDATEVHSYALRSMVAKFRERHLSEVASLGWESVWVVRPVVDLVHRLDA